MDLYTSAKKDRCMVMALYHGEDIERKTKEVWHMIRQARSLGRPTREGDVTDEMIEKARQYPFTELLVFKGKDAMCPFHEGKTPALRLYPEENRVWCFACNRGWDTIGWWMEKNDRSFRDAVMSLQG